MDKQHTELISYNEKIDFIPGQEMLMVEYNTKELNKLLENSGGRFTRHINTSDGNLIVPFGAGNCLPEELDSLIWNNENIPMIIENKVNFLMGSDLVPVTKSFEDGKFVIKPYEGTKVLNWLEKNGVWLKKQVESSAYNLENYGNYYMMIGFNAFKQAIYFKSYDAHFVRAVEMEEGEMQVSKYAVRKDLSTAYGEHTWQTVPSITDFNIGKNGFYYMFHGRKTMPGQPYYSLPVWYGAKKKIELHQMTTDAIVAGMKNGWNIKFKLSVHEKYYDDCETVPEKAAKKQALVSTLNNLLSGVDKYNSVLVVDMVSDHLRGQFQDLVKIEAIDNNKENDNLYQTVEKLGNSHTTSFNIDPELANIVVGGNLSSGSEIRNKYNMHVALKTPVPRRILLEWLKIFGKSNGWPSNLEWMFKDVEFTTTDANPNGQQSVATSAS